MRLDVYLSANGFAESRQKAQRMIEDGIVYLDGFQVKKSSHPIEEKHPPVVELRGKIMPYVGRGGYKLESALKTFCVNPQGLDCVDIGASTGGFTDCLLLHDAVHVVAVDAGEGQLAEKLRADPRVTNLEHTNARGLTPDSIGGMKDLVVCDVSFISLAYLFEAVARILVPCDGIKGFFLALIKPQFECGKELLGKNGIVRDPKVHLKVVQDIVVRAAEAGLYCTDCAPSPITGGDGNREFLACFACHAPERMNLTLGDRALLIDKLDLHIGGNGGK